jgi:hypothetical protein
MKQKEEALPPSRQEIDDVLTRFLHDELSLEETEQAVQQLHDAGTDVVSSLLSLLDAPLPEHHTVAAILLAATGDARLVPTLMERIRDPSLDDMLKVKLITTVEQLDPSIDPGALLDHLQDSHGALRQARKEHLRLLQSPQDLAAWLQSVQVEIDPLSRLQLIENSIDLGDPAAVPMLICLCYDPDDEVALAAMDAVERFKDGRALRTLEELAAHHPHRAVRTEAQKTVDRLHVRIPLSEQQWSPPDLPIHGCYLTPIDSTGGQVALVARHDVDGNLVVVSVMFDDQEGVKDCFGTTFDAGELVDMLRDYAVEGVSPVRVTHKVCLSALDMAVNTNWQSGRWLPAAFLAWREMIESGRPDVQAVPALLRIPAERREESLVHCYRLLFQDEFQFWLFHPDEIEGLRARYVQEVETTGGALGRERVAELLRQGVCDVVTDRWRHLIQGRLQRMVPLLREIYEEEDVWQWAAAAAEALADDSQVPVQNHPFLIGMLASSLEAAIGGPIGWFDG